MLILSVLYSVFAQSHILCSLVVVRMTNLPAVIEITAAKLIILITAEKLVIHTTTKLCTLILVVVGHQDCFLVTLLFVLLINRQELFSLASHRHFNQLRTLKFRLQQWYSCL